MPYFMFRVAVAGVVGGLIAGLVYKLYSSGLAALAALQSVMP